MGAKQLKCLVVFAALAFTAPAFAGVYTNEVLVLSSAATRVDTDITRRTGIELQNLGPNPIYCALKTSTDAVTTKSRRLITGETWSIGLIAGIGVYCRATTADQVTGAGTIVTEVP